MVLCFSNIPFTVLVHSKIYNQPHGQDVSQVIKILQNLSITFSSSLHICGQCLLFLPSYSLNPLLLLLFHKTCIVGQLFLLNLFYALCPSIKAAPNYIYSSEFLYDILYRPQQRYICFFQSYCPPICVQRS